MPYRIVERFFSDKDDTCPSFLLANIHSSNSVEQNLNKMEEIIQIAHEQEVNMVIFPELTVTGYIWKTQDHANVFDLLHEGENTRIRSRIKNIRDSLTEGSGGLEYIFYGNTRLKNDKFYNATFIINPGIDCYEEQYVYHKIFLTPTEKPFFTQGSDKRLSIDTKWGRFGFLICYDLCFMELARLYAFADKVDAIITMAAWHSEAVRDYPYMNIRTDHYYGFVWDLMNASKAVYNQIWSLGVNGVGVHEKSNEYFWGGSGVWAPSGMKLLGASNINEELLIIRNVNIRSQRELEQDDFNYRIEFENLYREIEHPDESTRFLP